MYKNENIVVNENLTKEDVLKEIPQLNILQYYLRLEVEPYQYFCSPSHIRVDNKATCMIYQRDNDKLVYRDYSGYFWGDCFDLIMFLEKCTFNEALNLAWYNVKHNPIESKKIYQQQHFLKSIHVKSRSFNEDDLRFWMKFNISEEILNHFKVRAVSKLWYNDTYDQNIAYVYKNRYDPCYAYYLGGKHWEVYFPSREKTKKHRSDRPKMKGTAMLPFTGKQLIITKSYKDIMSLYSLGYPACALPSESISPHYNVMEKLKERFEIIYTLLDYDNTGIRMSLKMKKEHHTIPIFITEGQWFRKRGYKGAKDTSDLIDMFNIEFTKKYLNGCIHRE